MPTPDHTNLPLLPPVFLHRRRVSDLLDGSDGRPVVVRAPGGSGKTLAVVDWLRSRRERETTVWVALDERAAEYAGFWQLMAAALVRAGAADERLIDFVRGFIPADVAREIVGDVLAGADGPARVVVDDAHLSPWRASADLVWMLRRGVRSQLVLTTRRRSVLESPSAAARFDPLVLTEAELAFDTAETVAVVEEVVRSGRPQPRFSAVELHEATSGHPLSTRVALAALHSEAQVDAGLIAQHTANDLLPAHGVERDVALRIALAPAVDDELATTLTGLPEAPAIVRSFEHEGLGEFAADGLFSFHAVIGEAFGRLARVEIPPAESARLLRIAALGLSRREGWAMTALRLASEAHAPDLIWRFFVDHFSELINHLRPLTKHFLEQVPKETMIAGGGAAAALAIVLGEDEPRPSLETLTLANGALETLLARDEPADIVDAYLHRLAIYAAYRSVRRYEETVDVSDRLLEMMLQMTPAERGRIPVAINLGMMQAGISNILAGRFDRAVEVLTLLAEDHPVRVLHVQALRAYAHAVTGRMSESRAFVADLPVDRMSQWRASTLSTGWYIARAVGATEDRDPRAALDILGEVGRRRGVIEHWPYLLWAEGLAWLVSDDPLTGRERLHRALVENRDRPVTPESRSVMFAAAADLELATGHHEGARAYLKDDADAAFPATLLSLSRLALAEDDPTRAGIYARRALAAPRLWTRHRAEAYVLGAAAAERSGQRGAARVLAHRALALAELEGLTVPLAMVARGDLVRILGEDADRLPQGLANPFGTADDIALTTREKSVLAGLVAGTRIRDIATQSHVSHNTVKTQVRGLYRKLGVSSRDEAAAMARQFRLLDNG
ncbi:LuxR C-terminal-related transcriptional regulator [Leifsonia sp. TF02-11]|uniref:helix-turn-helix transcriptional regulator n=1 Tax=Leifsonia sp. TF02-11 TaxID=2815212 RepID=UPI001AA162DE|nr:LuxR C-terminal-related transcriptional regulator [Leifsonia sp. TF02-11]MBO1741426.1 hypothetical protein [Leifsonia sp. TF02-11]